MTPNAKLMLAAAIVVILGLAGMILCTGGAR